MSETQRPSQEVAAEASLFEGLFRGTTLTDPMVRDLKALGVDPARLEARYRVDVWATTIDVVRQHVYPGFAVEEGNRRLGYDFSKGFQSTIGGKLVLALLPLVSVETLLARTPRLFKMGRADLVARWQRLTPTSGQLVLDDAAHVSPWFDLGLISFFVERIGTLVRTHVEVQSPRHSTITIEWKDR